MPGHFVGGHAAAGISRQKVGPLWLHPPDFGKIVPRRLDDVVVRGCIADQAARLHADHAAFRCKWHGHVAQVQDVAEHARHDEERCGLAPVALVEGNEELELLDFRRAGGRGYPLPRCALCPGLGCDQGRAGRDRRGLEQHRDRELHLEGPLHIGEKPHRDQRMPPQIEETVLDAHRADAQQVFPHLCELFLDPVARRDIAALEIRPLEALARATRGHCRLVGLGNEPCQRQGRHHDLRPVQRERPAQRLRTFGRTNALGHQIGQPLFGGGQGRLFARRNVKLHFRLGQRCGRKSAFQTLHGEIPDLDQNAPFGVGDRHVETRKAGRSLAQPNPGPDFRRKRRMKPDRSVGHGHPKPVGVIARHQPDGPTGCQIHQTRMHQMAVRQIATPVLGERQLCQSLTLSKCRAVQHVPTRTEGQMRLLRGPQPVPGPRDRDLLAACRDSLQVNGIRPRLGQGRKGRLCVQLPTSPAAEAAIASDLDARRACFLAQADPDLAQGAVLDREGAKEVKIADLAAPRTAKRRGFGQYLDIAGARQDRLPGLCAVLVEKPVARRERRGIGCIAAAVGPDGFQHGPLHGAQGQRIAGPPARDRRCGHADVGPDAPVDRRDPGLAAAPGRREGIQPGVRGDIVGLARRPGGRRGRGEQDHHLEAAIRQKLIQHPQSLHLRRQHRVHLEIGLRQQRRIVQRPCRVDHSGQPAVPGLQVLDQPPHLRQVGHIRLRHLDPAAPFPGQILEPHHRLHAARGPVGGTVEIHIVGPGPPVRQCVAAQKHHRGAVPAQDIRGQRQPDAAETTGDQIGAIVTEGLPLRWLERHRAVCQFEPFLAPVGGNRIGRRGQHVFQQPVAQRARVGDGRDGFPPPAPAFLCDRHNRFQVDLGCGHARHLAGKHPDRPGDQRLFGVRHGFVADLCGARGENAQVQR